MTKPALSLPVVVHTQIDKTRMHIAIAIATAALLCSLAVLIGSLRQPDPPVVISVSVKSLLEEHMVDTISQDISQAEAERRTSEYLPSLESAISDLTGDDAGIVIASVAVLGDNVPDFSRDVRHVARERATMLAANRGVTLGAQPSATQTIERMSAQNAELQSRITDLDSP
mgnify:CR=1 FL=1